jgi:hypothetical protein
VLAGRLARAGRRKAESFSWQATASRSPRSTTRRFADSPGLERARAIHDRARQESSGSADGRLRRAEPHRTSDPACERRRVLNAGSPQGTMGWP